MYNIVNNGLACFSVILLKISFSRGTGLFRGRWARKRVKKSTSGHSNRRNDNHEKRKHRADLETKFGRFGLDDPVGKTQFYHLSVTIFV